MATSPFVLALTSHDLLTRGYFHDRVIPPLSSTELSPAVPDVVAHITPMIVNATNNKFRLNVARTRAVLHSVPKRKHLRRILTIPHPLPYAILCELIESNWTPISNICASSTISLSVPAVSSTRAVTSTFQRSDEAQFRSRASVGMRYVLKTDLTRFYPSIYTHSIPWAIHGKAAARNDPQNTLYGNRLDTCVREMQDKQTGGIPIGPDTSFIIGEIIGSRIDQELALRLAPLSLRGTRFIDDYHLYFASRGEAERALAALHQVARMFELEINDTKTEVSEIPDVFEPKWKSDLRGMSIENNDSGRSVYTLFDRATEFALAYPFDSVFTYVAKKLLDATLDIQLWAITEPMLLRAAMAEPSMLTVLHELFQIHGVVDHTGLRETLEAICSYHAPLQQGYEVAWALWIACNTGTAISTSVIDAVIEIDDDIVALVALDLRSRGLAQFSSPPLWQSRMDAASLYSEHWLLSYEALRKGWLPSTNGVNYVANDSFFGILNTHAVNFYDPSGIAGQPFSAYEP